MKPTTVLKIILGFLVLVLLVFFVFENLDPVRIWIPLFKGRQCGLIYIIGVSYLIGVSNMFWLMVHFGARMKKKQAAKEVTEDGQELFEDEA
ncbi:MAG: hypothetical protein HQL21_07755 [Candidatus Omnitrophica bacterium]|nr:hypothetical protein [Candidatus Omnitrophota bacterium]